MLSKEQARTWKEAVWSGVPDADAFIAAVPVLEAGDIPLLLDLGKLDGAQQRGRAATFVRLIERSPSPAYFAPLVRALRTAPPPLRDAVAISLAIPGVNDLDGHSELCDLLRLPDAKIRNAASEVLRKVGGKRALQLITEMAQDPGCPGRLEAIDALVPMAGHHSLPALAAVVALGKPPEKAHALKYLGDPKYMAKSTSGAVRAIAPAVRDANELVSVPALLALGAIGSEDEFFEHAALSLDATATGAAARAAIEGMRRFKSPRVIAALRGRMQTGPTRLRFAVLQTLEAIGSAEVLPLLVEGLSHRIVQVRQAASETLVRLAHAGKVDLARTVVFLLRSKDVNARRMAADLARSVKDGTGDFWVKVVAALRDEDWWVRERVMDALVETAGWQVAGYVTGFLQEESAPLRRFAIDVLARIKRPESIPHILKVAQTDPDWWVQERAVEAVAGFGDERAIPFLIQLFEATPSLRIACLDALGRLKATAFGQRAVTFLADTDPDVRHAAIRFLSAINLQTPEIRRLTGDPSAEVARAAAALLARWNISVDAATDSLSRLDRLLVAMVTSDSDDLILESGLRPHGKRLGQVAPLAPEPLTQDEMRAILVAILTPLQLKDLDSTQDLDFSYHLVARGLRFRVNVFKHREGFGAVFRKIRAELPKFESLGLPAVVKGLADLPHGLVLVGGPTGSGKSTTLAALIAYINETYPRHIITIEDPIEVIHPPKKGMVNQREVGTHAQSFERALRATLREDPDVILVGEMRDLETIRFAIAAADTGHLVFATVHTTSADTAVDRLIGSFPPGEQQQIRSSLSTSLRAVVCQSLLPTLDGSGRVLALEILLNNDAVANMIRKAKSYQIPSLIATSREVGMRLMDHDLARLVKEKKISLDEALLKARNRKDVEQILGIGTPAPGAPGAPAAAGLPRAETTKNQRMPS